MSKRMDNIIEIRDLTKRFGRFTAVDGIDFSIRRGEILGFLGPNGAGKTTTIKMIIGLLKITEGDVFVKGMNVKRDLKAIKAIMGYMSQKFSLYPLLTPLENIEFFAGISGLDRSRIRAGQEAIRREIPEKLLTSRIQDLPPGIKQRVALFVCLMTDPEIVFLDEPTSGVDPENRRRFWNEIYALKQKGKTVLVTTHNLDEAEYADRIIIIHRGRIILQGEPDALLEGHATDSIETLFKEAIIGHEAN